MRLSLFSFSQKWSAATPWLKGWVLGNLLWLMAIFFLIISSLVAPKYDSGLVADFSVSDIEALLILIGAPVLTSVLTGFSVYTGRNFGNNKLINILYMRSKASWEADHAYLAFAAILGSLGLFFMSLSDSLSVNFINLSLALGLMASLNWVIYVSSRYLHEKGRDIVGGIALNVVIAGVCMWLVSFFSLIILFVTI